MDELFKALRHFIIRDLVFLVGGASLLTSFLHAFDNIPTPADHNALYLLMAGISYAVGYAMQDATGLLRVVPTTAPRNLNWYQRRLYERYTREPWHDIAGDFNFAHAEEALPDGRRIEWLERITSLQQIGATVGPFGATVGPCWIASAVPLAARWWIRGGRFDLATAIGGVCMGVVLENSLRTPRVSMQWP